MAEHATRAAALWPRQIVRAATRLLPQGPVRDRYRQEFLAELHGLHPTRQARHAFGVLTRCWALRVAITAPHGAAATDMEIVFPRRRGPLSCKLNLHHQWATLRTEDGKPYQQCQRCGKDETDMFAGSATAPGRTLDEVPPPPGNAGYWLGN